MKQWKEILMSTESLIQIKNFKKEYLNKVIHISNISIAKRVTIIIGENGSGKSTLFKGIANILKYDGEINHKLIISYMPENPHYPEDISIEVFLNELSYLERKNPIEYMGLLNHFDLRSKLHDKISSLSKGMKAKLNLIQCLMRSVDLYVLDEPLSGLDKESVKKLVKYIETSSKRFLISSHLDTAFKKLDKEVISL